VGGAVREGGALLQALPAADIAAAVCAHITADAPPHRAITAPASISSRDAAAIASTSAACKSTMPWLAPSLQRSSRRRSQRRWQLPSSSSWIARPAQALAARCRAGELRGRSRRAPLSCRRS
jgi:hypothetical protein